MPTRSLSMRFACSVEVAFQQTRDGEVAPALRPSLTAAIQALQDYEVFLQQHFLDRDPQDITFGGLSLEEFELAFSRAVQTNYYFTGQALDALDRLLDHRIAHFRIGAMPCSSP